MTAVYQIRMIRCCLRLTRLVPYSLAAVPELAWPRLFHFDVEDIGVAVLDVSNRQHCATSW